MKYPYVVLIIWAFHCQVVSCDSKKSIQKNSYEKNVTIDTNVVLISEEPKYISRDSSMNLIIKLLGLNKIKDISNNEEIRIWYNDRSVIGKIIVLRNTNDK